MKPNIIVIDDVLAVREEISDILSMEGYNVSEAENGKTGFRIIQNTKPDLILTDIVMPEMTGFELFKKLKKNPDTRHIPVIFLSAKADKDAVEKAKNLGIGDYIIKPVSPETLIVKIESRIKLSNPQRKY